MIKTTTISKSETEKMEKMIEIPELTTPNLQDDSSGEMQPSNMTIQNILNYSKALKISSSNLVGKVEEIAN